MIERMKWTLAFDLLFSSSSWLLFTWNKTRRRIFVIHPGFNLATGKKPGPFCVCACICSDRDSSPWTHTLTQWPALFCAIAKPGQRCTCSRCIHSLFLVHSFSFSLETWVRVFIFSQSQSCNLPDSHWLWSFLAPLAYGTYTCTVNQSEREWKRSLERFLLFPKWGEKWIGTHSCLVSMCDWCISDRWCCWRWRCCSKDLQPELFSVRDSEKREICATLDFQKEPSSALHFQPCICQRLPTRAIAAAATTTTKASVWKWRKIFTRIFHATGKKISSSSMYM